MEQQKQHITQLFCDYHKTTVQIVDRCDSSAQLGMEKFHLTHAYLNGQYIIYPHFNLSTYHISKPKTRLEFGRICLYWMMLLALIKLTRVVNWNVSGFTSHHTQDESLTGIWSNLLYEIERENMRFMQIRVRSFRMWAICHNNASSSFSSHLQLRSIPHILTWHSSTKKQQLPLLLCGTGNLKTAALRAACGGIWHCISVKTKIPNYCEYAYIYVHGTCMLLWLSSHHNRYHQDFCLFTLFDWWWMPKRL